MRKIVAFFVLLIPFYSIESMVRTSVGVEAQTVDDDEDNDEYGDDGGVTETIWIGPGWYYGYWFDNEGAYRHWYRGHHHGYYHGHYHGGGHHHGHGGHGGRHH